MPAIQQSDAADGRQLLLFFRFDSSTFRGKLLKIKHSDKHETSQGC